MSPRIDFLSCPIDALTMTETLDVINQHIQHNQPLHHCVVNAAKLVNMRKDPQLYESVVNSDLINADGQAVVWAARLLGKKIPERVAGIDLMGKMVEMAHQNNYKIFFLGAKEPIVQKVVSKYAEKYSPDIIAGYRNGYFKKEEENDVAHQIRNSGAHILLVAITSPKKEIFLNQHKNLINTPFIMGVGGSFDVVAGEVKRAPCWMQRMGLEWFYRVIQEPRRMWKRYLVTNSLFVFYVFKDFFSSRLKNK